MILVILLIMVSLLLTMNSYHESWSPFLKLFDFVRTYLFFFHSGTLTIYVYIFIHVSINVYFTYYASVSTLNVSSSSSFYYFSSSSFTIYTYTCAIFKLHIHLRRILFKLSHTHAYIIFTLKNKKKKEIRIVQKNEEQTGKQIKSKEKGIKKKQYSISYINTFDSSNKISCKFLDTFHIMQCVRT